MKRKISKLLSLIAIIALVDFAYSFLYNPSVSINRVSEAMEYSKEHNMNTQILIFCDFSRHTGTRRFMVYDTKKKKVILSSLCEQGKGGNFSNQPGSFCSSLGFYKICHPHKMSSGLSSYVLQGLSPTNSNAKNRGILIHPYFTVSDLITYPLPILFRVSKGCFVISPLKYTLLKKIIDKNNKAPILLYAY